MGIKYPIFRFSLEYFCKNITFLIFLKKMFTLHVLRVKLNNIYL